MNVIDALFLLSATTVMVSACAVGVVVVKINTRASRSRDKVLSQVLKLNQDLVEMHLLGPQRYSTQKVQLAEIDAARETAIASQDKDNEPREKGPPPLVDPLTE